MRMTEKFLENNSEDNTRELHGQREVEGIGGQFWYEAAGAI